MPKLLKALKFGSPIKKVRAAYSGPNPFGAKAKVGNKIKKVTAKKFKPFRNITNRGI